MIQFSSLNLFLSFSNFYPYTVYSHIITVMDILSITATTTVFNEEAEITERGNKKKYFSYWLIVWPFLHRLDKVSLSWVSFKECANYLYDVMYPFCDSDRQINAWNWYLWFAMSYTLLHSVSMHTGHQSDKTNTLDTAHLLSAITQSVTLCRKLTILIHPKFIFPTLLLPLSSAKQHCEQNKFFNFAWNFH